MFIGASCLLRSASPRNGHQYSEWHGGHQLCCRRGPCACSHWGAATSTPITPSSRRWRVTTGPAWPGTGDGVSPSGHGVHGESEGTENGKSYLGIRTRGAEPGTSVAVGRPLIRSCGFRMATRRDRPQHAPPVPQSTRCRARCSAPSRLVARIDRRRPSHNCVRRHAKSGRTILLRPHHRIDGARTTHPHPTPTTGRSP